MAWEGEREGGRTSRPARLSNRQQPSQHSKSFSVGVTVGVSFPLLLLLLIEIIWIICIHLVLFLKELQNCRNGQRLLLSANGKTLINLLTPKWQSLQRHLISFASTAEGQEGGTLTVRPDGRGAYLDWMAD